MQIQYELLKHRQSEYLKAIYETLGKQRIRGKSLLTEASTSTRSCFVNNNWYDVMSLSLINIDTTFLKAV